MSAPATALDPVAPKPEANATGDAPKRETRIAVIGDSDFATNGLIGAGRNADLFLNAVNWLAQQEDLIAIRPKRSRRSPDHPDRGAGTADLLPDGLHRAWPRAARRRADLVAEALMRRTPLVPRARRRRRGARRLLCYDSKRPPADEKKQEKVFADVQSDKIDRVSVKSDKGETTIAVKQGDRWQQTQPAAVAADEAEISGITSNLASLEVQRVVDEQPPDLKQFGLNPARIEVSFRQGGQGSHAAPRPEDADRRRHLRARVGQAARVHRRVVSRGDIQQVAVRPARQDDPEVRSRQD